MKKIGKKVLKTSPGKYNIRGRGEQGGQRSDKHKIDKMLEHGFILEDNIIIIPEGIITTKNYKIDKDHRIVQFSLGEYKHWSTLKVHQKMQYSKTGTSVQQDNFRANIVDDWISKYLNYHHVAKLTDDIWILNKEAAYSLKQIFISKKGIYQSLPQDSKHLIKDIDPKMDLKTIKKLAEAMRKFT